MFPIIIEMLLNQRVSLALSLFLVGCQANNLRSEPLSQSITTDGGYDPSAEVIGFVAGPVLFLLSFVMIWYNEKREAMNT